MSPVDSESSSDTLDLELIAQRILKLAEVATLEHLETLANGQAKEIWNLVRESEAA